MTSPTERSRTRPGAAVTVTAIALAVDMFLYGSLVPLLPELPAVAGSPVASALLFASYAIALLAATPLIGVWIDRSGPRAPLLAGLVGLAAATLLFAAVIDVTGTAGLLILLLARAAQGVAAAASWTAGLALIAATHEPRQRGRAMGLALSAVGAGILLGPLVSGLLSESFGPRAPFVLVAALAVLDAVARIVLVKDVGTGVGRGVGTAVGEAAADLGYRALLRAPRAAMLIGLTALGAAAMAFGEPILPLHLDQLGLGTIGIGFAFAGAALAGALGAPLAGVVVDRLGAARIAAVGAMVVGGGSVLAGQDSVGVAVAGLVAVGFGAQVILAPTLVLIAGLAEHVQPPAYGAAYAIYNIAYTAGLAVAPLLAGAGAAMLGTPVTMVTIGVVAAAAAVALAMQRRSPDSKSTGAESTGTVQHPGPASEH